MRNLLVTGGAGFIGSNFARYALAAHPEYQVVVYDKLTYAGRLENLADLRENPRFAFVEGDIADATRVAEAFRAHAIDTVVNFAAETHVDRSLMEPGSFIMTDVYGTYVLLETARQFGVERFLTVSTDEVYGQVLDGSSTEGDPLDPRSPYSASKAGGDLMVRAYAASYGLPVLITRGSNTFGPYQYPEKMIPLFITNAIDDLPLPVYGDGKQVRDWIYVLDHCRGIDVALHRGELGEIYNIGGGCEKENLDVMRAILDGLGKPHELLTFVEDRPGHDRRYSLDCSKLRALGWATEHSFEDALTDTLRWYRENAAWWRTLKGADYAAYYQANYGHRLAAGEGVGRRIG